MSIESIKTAIEERAKNASPLGAILKFKMDDQAITIDGNGSENVVSAEDKDADCTIKIADDTSQKASFCVPNSKIGQ